MKRTLTLFLFLLPLTGCSGPDTVETSDIPWEGEVNIREDVTMDVVEGTSSPDAVTISILSSSDAEIDSGNEYDFGIQAEKDGEWYPLKEPDNLANTAEALIYMKNQPRKFGLSWDSRYGSLPEGHYRVVKWFYEYNPEGPPHEHFALAAEFILD